MWLNHLLLPGYTRRRARTMEHGRFTLRRNLLWCSDAFTICCWNGERVSALFGLDCDRVTMRWLVTTGGVSGEMVRDPMTESVEYRFGPAARSLWHPIEWQSDNVLGQESMEASE